MKLSKKGLLFGLLSGVVFWMVLFLIYQSNFGDNSNLTTPSEQKTLPIEMDDTSTKFQITQGQSTLATVVDHQSFNVHLEEIKLYVHSFPEVAIDVLEAEIEDLTRDLDIAAAKLLLAEANSLLGNQESSKVLYQEVILLIEPMLTGLDSPLELTNAYTYLITASFQLGNSKEAETIATELNHQMEGALEKIKDRQEIALIYQSMIESSLILGNFEYAETLFSKMEDESRFALVKPTTLDEIGPFYVTLLRTSDLLNKFEKTEGYSHRLYLVLKDEINDLLTLHDCVNWYEFSLKISSYLDFNQLLVEERSTVLKMIFELVSETEDLNLSARANRILGDSEFESGNYQFAAAYYKRLYEVNPKVENIYLAAIAYFAGGNNSCAYHWFQLLLEQDDPEVEIYRDTAESVIDQIGDSYANICPCPSCPGN